MMIEGPKGCSNVEDMTSIARDWRPFRSVAANLIWADYD